MPKSLKITDKILSKIKASTGNDGLTADQVTVFEAVLADTRALSQKGSIYDGGRIARSTLVEMADHMAQPGNRVVLITLHKSGELPVGNVFDAQVFDTQDGETELRGLFYVSNTEADMVQKLEDGTIDSVSIGLLPKKLLCSECGFDYIGEGDFMNVFTRTCDNEHVVGENGVHVRSVGLDAWLETSLVPNGAVRQAKIISSSQSKLGQEQLERLAASGVPAQAVILTANFEETGNMSGAANQGDNNANLSQLLADTSGRAAVAETKLEAANTKIADLETQLAAANTKIGELEAQAAETAASTGEDVTKLKKQLEAASEALQPYVAAALTASGKKADEIPGDITAQLALVGETGMKLHQLIPEGGVAENANGGSGSNEDAEGVAARLNAFKSPKRGK